MTNPDLSAQRVGICFDLDGTLVDSAADLAAAVNAMVVEAGHAPLSPADVALFIGKGADVLVQRVMRRLAGGTAQDALEGPLPAGWEAMRLAFDRHYARLNGQASHCYPGVVAGLQRLADAGLRLACVTNKPEVFVRPLLAARGIASFFEVVIGGDTLPVRKPDPGPLLEVCRRWGCSPQAVTMVGDSIHDAHAARAAGMSVVVVPYGYNGGARVEDWLERGDVDGIVPTIAVFADRLLQSTSPQ